MQKHITFAIITTLLTGFVPGAGAAERISPEPEFAKGAQGVLQRLAEELNFGEPRIHFAARPEVKRVEKGSMDPFYWNTKNQWKISVSDGWKLLGKVLIDTSVYKYRENYEYEPVKQTMGRIDKNFQTLGFTLAPYNSEQSSKYDDKKSTFVPDGRYYVTKAYEKADVLCLAWFDSVNRSEAGVSAEMQRNPGNEEVYFSVRCVDGKDFESAKARQLPFLKALKWKNFPIDDNQITYYKKKAPGYAFIGPQYYKSILQKNGAAWKVLYEMSDYKDGPPPRCSLLKKHKALKRIVRECQKGK